MTMATIQGQTMTERQKGLAACACLMAQGDMNRLEPTVRMALNKGVTINELKPEERMNREWEYVLVSEDNFYGLSSNGATITKESAILSPIYRERYRFRRCTSASWQTPISR